MLLVHVLISRSKEMTRMRRRLGAIQCKHTVYLDYVFHKSTGVLSIIYMPKQLTRRNKGAMTVRWRRQHLPSTTAQ